MFGTGRRLEIALFTRQLAVMLAAGVTIQTALDLLTIQHLRSHLFSPLRAIARAVDAGASAAAAFRAQEATFGYTYVNVVALAEAHGRLPEGLLRLAEYTEREMRARARFTAALIYPAFCFIGTIAMTWAIFAFMLPMFEPLIHSAHDVPVVTQVLFALAETVRQPLFVPTCVVAISVLVILLGLWLRTQTARASLDRIVLRLPVFGRLVRSALQSQVGRNLATLLATAVPIHDAVRLVCNATNNVVYREDLQQLQRSLMHGLTPGEHCALNPRLYSPIFVGMLNLGEETGNYEKALRWVSTLLDDEVDRGVAVMFTLLEPVLLGFMASIVAFVSIAVFLPLYSSLLMPD